MNEDSNIHICLIEFDKNQHNFSKWVNVNGLRLDVQYYREKRLKELLR